MSTLVAVDRALAQLLCECALAGSSGIVSAGRGRLRRLFCVERGRLVHAASNVIEEQLAERLAELSLVSREALDELRGRAKERGVGIDRLLEEGGIVSPQALRSARAEQIRQLLFSTLNWPDGECRLDRGMPDLPEGARADLCCATLLVEYARKYPPTLAEVRSRIGPPTGRPFANVEQRPLVARVEDDGSLLQLFDRCDGARTSAQLAAVPLTTEEANWRRLYVLLLMGVIEVDTAQKSRHTRPQGRVTREEVLARLERSREGDHYGVLELPSASNETQVREAYYFLARRYHPDRFRTGPLRDLLERIETYFAQVTEAYNTLTSRDQRQAYDQARDAAPSQPAQREDTRFLARQNYIRARSLLDRRRRAEAVQYLENATRLDPGNAHYFLELGNLLAGNPRRRDEAERALIRVNELDPSQVDGYLGLAEIYVKLDRREDAARLYREVLRWEPGHIRATARLKELG
jgi:curved DNA-binding protein CbpA